MKYVWCTDIHLNFLEDDERYKFYDELEPYDGVIISGDISEAPGVRLHLLEMYWRICKPIYFVLGNHDYYRGDVQSTREQMNLFNTDEIKYLTSKGPLKLFDRVYIMGVDGWADARAGDYERSDVCMNDNRLIADLRKAGLQSHPRNRDGIRDAMRKLALEDTNNLLAQFEKLKALGPKELSVVMIVTHVPPFAETARYNKEISDDDHLPYYCNVGLGDAIIQCAESMPFVRFNVLCGHTHEHYRWIHPEFRNICVNVGHSEYGEPTISGTFEYSLEPEQQSSFHSKENFALIDS